VSAPCYLLIELAEEHARQARLLEELAGLVRAAGGTVLAWAPPGRVAGLEPATVAAGLLIAKWPSREAARKATEARLLPRLRAGLPGSMVPLILAVEGLPEAGLPEMMDIPTVASVPKPPSPKGNVLLVIRGSAWDQAKLDQYRDVILPMHKERGGYYEVFAVAPGQVEAFSGEWRDAIFAISRWPTRVAAEDFWYSERYQGTAIPIRLGAGRFSVHMLEASAG
jgi:uncharacterized protein (DUF1330 family)